MGDSDWLNCQDVTKMLTWLEGKVSPRKLRLFAVACCWRIWPLLVDGRSRKAVKVAERFAEGQVPERDRFDAYLAARAAADELGGLEHEGPLGPDTTPAYLAALAARNAVGVFRTAADLAGVASTALRARLRAQLRPSLARRLRSPADYPGGKEEERLAQADLLRDLVGPPRPVYFDPTWNSPLVLAMVESLAETRDFSVMPVLADALEDSGCAHPLILAHCRADTEHARGCWVLDGLLGRT
jgi:hypothetical protein